MKWVGRCGECQSWGSVSELGVTLAAKVKAGPVTSPAVPIAQVAAGTSQSRASGVDELDRVLGGGIVPGAVLLLAGEPGVGKSTLLLEVAAKAARGGTRVLYVSGEESAAQVRMRAQRTGALEDNLYVAAEVDLSAVLGHIEAVDPQLLVIDSVQTIATSEIDGISGSITQVRAVTGALVRVAKDRNLPTLLVGHVTKDGSIAGPRALEHIVDVVLQFEGERNSRLRVLRAVKNRFGPVDEIGCFDLTDEGIVEVTDPSGIFVSRHGGPTSGSCLTVTLEGRRPLISEVQALVTNAEGNPRRAVSGLDAARLSMLIAVLDRRIGIQMGPFDVYASTVGGATLKGPAADLPIIVAMVTARLRYAVPHDVVVIGEVGLAGELRRVPSLTQRLGEAARLGFSRAVVPAGPDDGTGQLPAIPGLEVAECRDLWSALSQLRLVGSGTKYQAVPELRVVG